MTPVYLDFLDVLKEVFLTIYTVTVGPVMTAFFVAMWKQFTEFFMDLAFTVLYQILNFLLHAVAILDQMITLFSGLGTYSYNGTAQNASLFEYLFHQEGISKVLSLITILAVCLSVLFTIYSTGKSISDSVLDPDYKPVSKVLGDAFKTAMTFAATPILCLLIIQLSTAVLTQIDYATSDIIIEQTIRENEDVYGESSEAYTKFRNSQPGVADMLFQIFSQDAIRNKKEAANIYTQRNAFQNVQNVKKNFDIRKINYFSGFLAVGFIAVILLLTTLGFAVRMFEILVLYMVAPFFTASIPLDGGGRYRKWRELFIAKLAGAFGPIFTMKLFLVLMPLMTTSKLQLSPDSSIDWVMKVLLMCGAIYSTYKGRHMIVEIFSPEAAAGMRRSEMLMKGIARQGVQLAGMAMGVPTSMGGKNDQESGNQASPGQNPGTGGGQGDSPGGSQAFRG